MQANRTSQEAQLAQIQREIRQREGKGEHVETAAYALRNTLEMALGAAPANDKGLVPMEVCVLPDMAVVARLDACGTVHALQLYARTHGIVGKLEHDAEHGVVLNGDRLVYTAQRARA